jgi:hypothetical protein
MLHLSVMTVSATATTKGKSEKHIGSPFSLPHSGTQH